MSGETELERKICEFLRQNGKSTALVISKHFKKVDKSTVNKHLYKLKESNRVFMTDKKPPVWDLVENMNEKQRSKPEQKPPTTGDTCEEEQVSDLLRSGRLKASQIAKDLGQDTKSVNKQLYSMKEKGKVQKCSKSNLWSLNDEERNESHNKESDHRRASMSGLSQSFDVIETLGQGGYGCVYKVKHKYDDKIYAVKQVTLTRRADSEVKALARLEAHPNIVRYFTCWPDSENWTSNREVNPISSSSGSLSDFVIFERPSKEESDDVIDDVTSGMESLGVTGSASAAESSGNHSMDSLHPSNDRTYLFIQMEFCEGGTLTSWIQKKNLKENPRTPQIHQIFKEIISGVEYIHSNNLIHRDLKPDNILFSADGKVKIGDFGLVAAQINHNGDPIERSGRRGTPQYMSPEQENKRNYDEKTDIFPLGLVWFEMLWKLSTGMERAELWPDLRNQKFPEGFCDSYPTENKFIKKMLSYEPAERPHAKDIRENLEMFLSLHQSDLSQKTI